MTSSTPAPREDLAQEQGGCLVRSFLTAKEFQRWCEQRRERVDVLLDCDAVSARRPIDVDAFRSRVLRRGGLCLAPGLKVLAMWDTEGRGVSGALEPCETPLYPEVPQEQGAKCFGLFA